jgi:YHS domain-containing protein
VKEETVKCEFCKTDVSAGTCKFANYKTVIDGKEYVFCCAICAKQSKKRNVNKR